MDSNLTSRPDAALVDVLRIPEPFISPARKIFRMRVLYALLGAVRGGAHRLRGSLRLPGQRQRPGCQQSALVPGLSLLRDGVTVDDRLRGHHAVYADSARLVNVIVITPLRVAFLIVLIGTTVETLTTQSRQALKIQRWRNKVRNHTVVVGYGTKGPHSGRGDGRR